MDRLRRRLKLACQFLRCAAGTHQLHHLTAELRRIGSSLLPTLRDSSNSNRPLSTKPGQLHPDIAHGAGPILRALDRQRRDGTLAPPRVAPQRRPCLETIS